uniref:Uncharacterized protein n=1 Tax=Prevotella sp. GTC17262 TaxID=3236797 RepID=A0AB33JKC7_9BACT
MTSVLKRIYHSFCHVYERRDLTTWDVEPDTHAPIYGVYHLMMDTGWEELAAEQLGELQDSGLLDATEKLYISVITDDTDRLEQLRQMLPSPKMELISLKSNPREYEYPALKFIKQLAGREDCLIYYFHSKGISYQCLDSNDPTFRSFSRKIKAWRKLIQYFIFYRWKVAVNALTEGYDTYGSYRWPPKNYTMFSGNFWWVRSAFIRKLPDFDTEVIRTNRFYSEVWLFERPQRCLSAFETIADLYYVNIPPSIYREAHPPLADRLRFVLTYNYRKFLKHACHYDYKKRCQQRFQELKEKIA